MSSLAQELAVLPQLPDALPRGALSLEHLQRSVSHEGGLGRIRCFLAKLRAGENVTVAVLGGSVSAGSSSRVRPDQSGLFHRKLQRWIATRFPGSHVSHVNAAMPAVPPGYMEQCLALHIPSTVDLVLLEAAANMCGRVKPGEASDATASATIDPCELGRQSVERMLRQVMRYPTNPAVIMVHAYPFWTMETPKSWWQQYGTNARGGRKRGKRVVAADPLSISQVRLSSVCTCDICTCGTPLLADGIKTQ